MSGLMGSSILPEDEKYDILMDDLTYQDDNMDYEEEDWENHDKKNDYLIEI